MCLFGGRGVSLFSLLCGRLAGLQVSDRVVVTNRGGEGREGGREEGGVISLHRRTLPLLRASISKS